MIPSKSGTSVISNMPGRDIKMSIDPDSYNFLMGHLTNLYQDPVMAFVREYATNAWDSHKQAGVDRPILVTIPTALKQEFTIQDFGVGMSVHDIETIYSQYGASTKRNSNDVNGMLGFGCKSALAYVDQFFLTSVKDGQKIVAAIFRNDDGGSTIKIVSEEPSDEGNGTLVSIPCLRDSRVDEKAKHFFSFWDKGSVLIDGKEPESLLDPYVLTDDMTVVTSPERYSYRTQVYVVMGNVPYRTEIKGVHLPDRKDLVVRVPIGSVDFPPNRESLRDTNRTKSTLEQIAKDFKAACTTALDNAVKDAKRIDDAIEAANRVRESLGLKEDVKWRKQVIPFDGEAALEGENLFYHSTHYYRHNPSEPMKSKMPLMQARRATWIVNFSNKRLTSQMREKAIAFAAKDEITLDTICFYSGKKPLLGKWNKQKNILDWTEIRKWRNPANKAAASSSESYDTYTYDTTYKYMRHSTTNAKDFDTSLPIYYIVGRKCHSNGDTAKSIHDLIGKAIVVRMPNTRVNKFLRLFPDAEEAGQALRNEANKWQSGLTKDQRTLISLTKSMRRYYYRNSSNPTLARFDEARILDPEFSAAVQVAKTLNEDENSELVKQATKWSEYLNSVDDDEDILGTLIKRYPLAENQIDGYSYGTGDKEIEHITLYANAVYSANLKDKK